jgi:hypothetical protein
MEAYDGAIVTKLRALWLATALLALEGCALPPTLAQLQSAGAIMPLRGDLARIYVFRNYRSSGPPIDPTVYIDGQPVGVSAMGSVFERDVPPGVHIVATDPKDPAYAEITSVRLNPGDTVYLAVDDNLVNDNTQATRVVVYSIAPINSPIAKPMAERLPFQSPASGQAMASSVSR